MAAIDFTPKDEKRARRDFTREELLERLSYCPETGLFRWKMRVRCQGGGRMPGDVAGTDKDGYVQIKLFGRQYRAHHLAWLVQTGEWPPAGVDMDHINRKRDDNRWDNLRLANRSQNNLNTRKRKVSKSGHRGVHKNHNGDKWSVRIGVGGRIVLLGSFATLEEAIAARKKAERHYYKDFA